MADWIFEGNPRHYDLAAAVASSRGQWWGTPHFRDHGHTPLSVAEDIPWRCRRLVIGTGADGALPVMRDVRDEALRRRVDLVLLPTAEAIGALTKAGADTNAVLQLTC
jgi:hypothetical protein